MLIKVSGNIISELSEKIPSITIALNELIKNSYDAGACKAVVTVNSNMRRLTVVDDGSGMNISDINKLFHISKSDKKYGQINEYNRYTQGSKGLGFLSVFKFGSKVTWKTRKVGCQGYKFSVNFDELLEIDNITDFDIEIEDCSEIMKGTYIDIEMSEENLKYTIDYLSNEMNYRKIVNSFIDDTFTIELDIDGIVYSSKDIPNIKKILPERQLFYVTYSSQKQLISFYYKNQLIKDVKFDFNSDKYRLEIEVIIYHLKANSKSKITKLFFNPRLELTPLIYVNHNLFNNYDIFDPNITRPLRHSQSLPQMIGYIKLFSSHEQMGFNSDRSQFLQNELTDSIRKFLELINVEIQKLGSEYKRHLFNLDFLKTKEFTKEKISDEEILRNIREDYPFKEFISFKTEENRVVYSIFGEDVVVTINNREQEEINSIEVDSKLIPAKIELKSTKKEIPVCSSQINLFNEIAAAKDSTGNDIDHSAITVKVGEDELRGGILPSVPKPCTKIVTYTYEDRQTGLVTAKMVLEFVESKILTINKKPSLFSLPIKSDYTISFNDVVNNIKEQIDSLEPKEYKEIIACSLRSLFELSVGSIIRCGEYNDLNLINEKNLDVRVAKIIEHVSSNNSLLQNIADSTLLGYNNLKNLLIVGDFTEAVNKSHVGAHTSYNLLTLTDIESIARKVAIFMVIVNEMISISNDNKSR